MATRLTLRTFKHKKRKVSNINHPTVISNEFNDFFVNVGPDSASRIHNTGKPYYDYIKAAHDKSIFMKPIIEDEIIKIIGKFDKNKSAGHDGIGNLIVKRVANEIARPLSAIFNLSITTGIFPDQLKVAKVIPIYKKDDNNNNNNMETCKAQESVKKPLTALQTGEQRNMKVNAIPKTKIKQSKYPTIQKYTTSH